MDWFQRPGPGTSILSEHSPVEDFFFAEKCSKLLKLGQPHQNERYPLWTLLQVFYNPYNNERNPFGDSASVYDFISCWKAPDGNSHNSYITFFSTGRNSIPFRPCVIYNYLQYTSMT
jgi:hypothetical protein